MKLILFSLALLSTQAVLASSIKVNCKTPKGFAGQAATIQGVLKKAPKPSEGYIMVTGKLKVTIGGSASRSLFNKAVAVRGVILEGGAISMIADKNPELTAMYVNFATAGVSFVELDGKSFKTDCKN